MTASLNLLQTYSSEVEKAFDVLKDGGTVLVPTALGWTLCAMETPEGALALNAIKHRPDSKPLGLVGTEEAFKAAFGGKSPPVLAEFCYDVCIAFVSQELVSDENRLRFGKSCAVGPKGEIAFWLNCGPYYNKLAQLVDEEFDGRCLLGTSGNTTGNGNPKGETFDLNAVEIGIRDAVDYIMDIPHYSSPELDEFGRWLSAPMFDMDTLMFRRKGKHMKKVETIMSLFNGMDHDGDQTVSLDEFTAFVKTGVGKKIFFSDAGKALSDQDIKEVFRSVDKDHSGEIDFDECYVFIETRLKQEEGKTGKLASLFDTNAPEYNKEELRKYFLHKNDEDFENMFQEMDVDQSGTVDFYEVFKYEKKVKDKFMLANEGTEEDIVSKSFSKWDV